MALTFIITAAATASVNFAMIWLIFGIDPITFIRGPKQ